MDSETYVLIEVTNRVLREKVLQRVRRLKGLVHADLVIGFVESEPCDIVARFEGNLDGLMRLLVGPKSEIKRLYFLAVDATKALPGRLYQ